jgi:hypothetical protein
MSPLPTVHFNSINLLHNRIPTRSKIFIPTLLLLIVAASRITRLAGWEMDNDEVWTVWQTFGSPLEIIRWTPYDWPPLHFLLVGLWKELVGIHPTIVTYLSVLIFMVGAASMYRLTCRVRDQRAAVIAVLVYASLGRAIVLSMLLRGYVLQLSLLPLTAWLAIRYFERVSTKRAIPLTASMVLMMYTHFTSIISIGLIGLYTLIIYGKAVWRWWLPGIVTTLLFIPEIIVKLSLTVRRETVTRQMEIGSLPHKLRALYQDYAGYHFYAWLVLFLVATVLIVIFHNEKNRRQIAALATWALLFPVLMYYLNPLTGFFYWTRHSLWIVIGLGLWIGWGTSYLPDLLLLPVAVVLACATFTRLPVDFLSIDRSPYLPMKANFSWLEDFVRAGDVIVVDPNVPVPPEQWDYFIHAYFPHGGLQGVDEPGDYRRVWYVTVDWLQNKDLYASVLKGRIPERWVGPPTLLFRLYEAPPDPKGVLFENGMRFLGADVITDTGPDPWPLVWREGQSVRLRLWWSADRPVGLDYSVGTYILDLAETQLVAAYNGPPNVTNAPKETSQWISGRYYVEDRKITIPYPTQGGEFRLCMAVYQWWDNARIPAPGETDSYNLLCLKKLYIKVW